MPPKLPEDNMYHPIPVLRPSTIANLTIGSSSASVALPTGAEVMRLAADVDCWYLLGGSSVSVSSTTGVFLPAGVEIIAVGDNTYIAVIQYSGSGNLNIVDMV